MQTPEWLFPSFRLLLYLAFSLNIPKTLNPQGWPAWEPILKPGFCPGFPRRVLEVLPDGVLRVGQWKPQSLPQVIALREGCSPLATAWSSMALVLAG